MDYNEFLKKKEKTLVSSGFDVDYDMLNNNMFDYQKDIVIWALKKGKCALFLDTGLGKTLCQLEFADKVCKHSGGNALILAPLAVSKQTKQEGLKFGYFVNICRNSDDVVNGINITNYEMLGNFDVDEFVCVILDESSILKSFMGKTTNQLINVFERTPYKLCCTSTPSPNDYTELGNHAEFLGIMSRTEMLATYFINDAKESQWRLKGHAESEFWKWIASWGMVMNSPSNLGYDSSKYVLPDLHINYVLVDGTYDKEELSLFPVIANTLTERREIRKCTIINKALALKEILSKVDNCLIWVDYNSESELIANMFNVPEVTGSQSPDAKEELLLSFANGDIKYLVSKPSICGFGMNFQKCNNMVFVGLSDSYERFYQAIRRCWRYGQSNDVNVYIIMSESEMPTLNNIKKKEVLHNKMSVGMIDSISNILKSEINNTIRITTTYTANNIVLLPSWLKER